MCCFVVVLSGRLEIVPASILLMRTTSPRLVESEGTEEERGGEEGRRELGAEREKGRGDEGRWTG